MRTGRTQENTNLNVRARQRTDEVSSYMRRMPPSQQAPVSYSYSKYQYENNQYNSTRPTAIGRPLPGAIRCGECGGIFNHPSARFCPHCGSKR